MRSFDVLVASHGQLAEALVSTAFLICGETDRVRAVGLQPSDSPEGFAERLLAALDPDRPTLILCDLYGGTPHNVVLAAARMRSTVRCISGANLGLLLEAMTADQPMDDLLVDRLVALAQEGVVDVSRRVGMATG